MSSIGIEPCSCYTSEQIFATIWNVHVFSVKSYHQSWEPQFCKSRLDRLGILSLFCFTYEGMEKFRNFDPLRVFTKSCGGFEASSIDDLRSTASSYVGGRDLCLRKNEVACLWAVCRVLVYVHVCCCCNFYFSVWVSFWALQRKQGSLTFFEPWTNGGSLLIWGDRDQYASPNTWRGILLDGQV